MKLNPDLKKEFFNKTILVTGGTGSIGSEIVRQLIPYKPRQIRIFSRDESKHFFLSHELVPQVKGHDMLRFLIGDIRDKDRLDRAYEGVDIVFHAAALKHVPLCEYNPFEAIKTNVLGTQNVIDLAIKHNVKKVVAISTDKAVNPNSVLGVTKLLMEKMIRSTWNYSGKSQTKFAAVRFGNVLNSRGSLIPLWLDQIKKGGPVTVTDKNMKRFFMSIPGAVSLVFLASTLVKGNEVFVLKMPEYKIYDLAEKVIKKYSPNKPIKIKIIGVRPGEKVRELLFTEEEEALMVDMGPFYVISQHEKAYHEYLQMKKKNLKKTVPTNNLKSFVKQDTMLNNTVIDYI